METQVRKLPKKTMFYVALIVMLGIAWFFMVSYGKEAKASTILQKLGYENFSNVKVFAKHEFLREDINVKGYKYTVSFVNKSTNEMCKGFILMDFKRNVTEDLICKKR